MSVELILIGLIGCAGKNISGIEGPSQNVDIATSEEVPKEISFVM